MKVNLFTRIVLVVIAICLVSISFAVWTQTVKDEFSITKVDSISYIPKEWGNLKAVTLESLPRGDIQQYLFFETSDGTIYIVTAYVDYKKPYGLRLIPQGAVKILREGVSVQPEKKEAPGTGF